MKQVYLVHSSGERYGPVTVRKIKSSDKEEIVVDGNWFWISALYTLGFRIEQVVPDKIELTREAFERYSSMRVERESPSAWEQLVAAAEGK